MVGGLVASDVVFYDPVSAPITNRVTSYQLSLSDVVYRNATNALIVTNRSTQILSGVNAQTYGQSVVDGQTVRLMTQAELDRIAATNALNAAAAEAQMKYDARSYASNIVSATDGQSLFLRSIFKATWLLINNTRTNAGQSVISQNAYLTIVYTNIADYGQ